MTCLFPFLLFIDSFVSWRFNQRLANWGDRTVSSDFLNLSSPCTGDKDRGTGSISRNQSTCVKAEVFEKHHRCGRWQRFTMEVQVHRWTVGQLASFGPVAECATSAKYRALAPRCQRKGCERRRGSILRVGFADYYSFQNSLRCRNFQLSGMAVEIKSKCEKSRISQNRRCLPNACRHRSYVWQ